MCLITIASTVCNGVIYISKVSGGSKENLREGGRIKAPCPHFPEESWLCIEHIKFWLGWSLNYLRGESSTHTLKLWLTASN